MYSVSLRMYEIGRGILKYLLTRSSPGPKSSSYRGHHPCSTKLKKMAYVAKFHQICIFFNLFSTPPLKYCAREEEL